MPILGAIPVVGGIFGGAGATWATAAAGVAAVGSVAGAAYGAYSGYQAGKLAQEAGDYNAFVQQGNARIAMLQREAEMRAAEYQARADAATFDVQAVIADARARAAQQSAEANDATTRENLRRRREEFARFRATQSSRYAKSGVTAAGSPVAVLAETAARMQLELQDMLVEGENRSRGLLDDASVAIFNAGGFRQQASITRAGAKQGLSYNRTVSGVDFSNAMLAADATRIEAGARASAYRREAVATGISGLSQFGRDYYEIADRANRKKGYTFQV